MVEHHLARRGIADERVLAAMRTVPREAFVAHHLESQAYEDRPLPIEAQQTISQPYIVALMAEAAELTPTSKVLEIGAGSGYGAAVLGQIAARVWTIERHEILAATATQRLEDLGYRNVTVVQGDGTLGLPDQAPFDAIIVTAAARRLPDALTAQLVDGGRLIIPVGPRGEQELLRVRRNGDALVRENLGGVRFVPLIPD